MLKKIFIVSLSLLMFVGNGFGQLLTNLNLFGQQRDTGTLEKMIVANGSVAMDLDLNRLNGTRLKSKELPSSVLRFDAERDSFFHDAGF